METDANDQTKEVKLQNYKSNFKDPNQNHITEKSPSLTTPTKPHSLDPFNQ